MRLSNFRFAKVGIALAWAAAVGGAQAYSVGTQIGNFAFVYQGSYLDDQSAAVQNSTLVTERRVATAATEAQTNMVLSQIADRFGSPSGHPGSSVSLLPTSGGNAGSMEHRSSVWARAGYDNLKEDNITNFGGWKGNLWTVSLGYDYKFNDKLLGGAALVYSNLNGSTAFNRGHMRDNAYGIVPYLAFKVSPCFDIDFMIGYSRVNKNRDRTAPSINTLAASLTGPKATSSPRSDRYFGSVFANWKHYVNHWNLLARLGYTYITDRQKGFNEKNGAVDLVTNVNPTYLNKKYNGQSTSLNRLSLRLQAGYKASAQIEPYAFLLYALDMGASRMRIQDAAATNSVGITIPNANKNRNNNNYGGGLGLNACLHSGWTAGIEGTYLRSKKYQDIGGQLRIAKKF